MIHLKVIELSGENHDLSDLTSTLEGVYIYLSFSTLDNVEGQNGVHQSKILIYCLNNVYGAIRLVGLDWYKGGNRNDLQMLPSLAVCYDIGRCQIMRSHDDPDPVLLDTGIQITCSCWNEDGSMLAVAGTQKCTQLTTTPGTKSNDRDINVVQFYNPLGDHLRTLCLPGKCLTACAWEGNGSLRLALTFSDEYNSLQLFTTTYVDTSVVFWNLKTKKTKMLSVRHLLHICAAEDYVCLVCKVNDCDRGVLLTLCTAIGVALESKRVQFEPIQTVMTANQIILVNKSFIYAWQCFTPKQILDLGSAFTSSSLRQRDGIERLYHIDTVSMKTSTSLDDDNIVPSVLQTGVNWDILKQPASSDPICTITVSQSTRRLFIARESGSIQFHRLPDLYLEMTFRIDNNRPYRIYVNCDATCLAVVDESGILRLHLIPDSFNNLPSSVKFQNIDNFMRKDVWDVKFEEENPHIFAIMEKTRMYIFDGLQAEPAVQASTFLYEFKDLEVQGILLDELVAATNQPNEEFLMKTPIKVLRDFKQILEKDGLEKASEFVNNNPHVRLRRLLIEACLEKQNLDMAELQFVHLQEYSGIQFIKKLRNIQSKLIRKAEINAYFKRYDEAETLLLKNDRPDLAVELRKRLGDWFRVAQLTKDTGILVKDVEQSEIWNAMGDHFRDQMFWDKAADYYQQGNDFVKFAECLYQLEDYQGIGRLIEGMPDCHNALHDFGLRFASLGMIQEAVFSLMKGNHRKEAIDICLRFNHWRIAYELAKRLDTQDINSQQQYGLKQLQKKIDDVLNQSVNHFIEKGKVIQAVELYKCAGRFLEAAELLYKEAQKARTTSNIPPLYMKKMYVLIGLLMEQYYEQTKQQVNVKPRNTTCGEGVLQASSAIAGLLLAEKEHTLLNYNDVNHLDTKANHKENKKGNESTVHKQSEILKNTTTDGKTNQLPSQQLHNSTRNSNTDMHLARTSEIGRLIDQPWRGAKAYHYMMLAEKQLYAGSVNRAFRTAQLLKDYEDILNPYKIYSLIALCSIYAKNFATCSKAFIKLENLTDISQGEHHAIKELALDIFSKHQPTNEQTTPAFPEMDSMLESEAKIPVCIVTGQPVTDYQFWMCPTCKHCAYEHEITRLHNCPLCHFPVQ
ncbi:unnamed protein product [Heterobilharzia americana]|nr:unnamed protein product [Heterobilharzia americana]